MVAVLVTVCFGSEADLGRMPAFDQMRALAAKTMDFFLTMQLPLILGMLGMFIGTKIHVGPLRAKILKRCPPGTTDQHLRKLAAKGDAECLQLRLLNRVVLAGYLLTGLPLLLTVVLR